MIELSSCLWIPERDFTEAMEGTLTVRAFQLDGSETVVRAFRTDREGWIGIPRVYGLKLISNIDYRDARSLGQKVVFPGQVSLYEEQVPFVDALFDATETRSDFVAQAATGKGKTVMGLAVIQRIGRTAAILVDQENLMDQWVERCVEHLGMRAEDVGIVRGPRADYEGKAITICMVQTLTRRRMSEAFYRYFGVVVFDECQIAGAPTFSRTLMMFPAKTRFGLSATPDRKDELNRIIRWNLGTTDVSLDTTPGKALVYIMESEGVYSFRVNNSKMTGAFVNEVAADGKRNLLLVQAIRWLYDSGRDVLAIGDRIEHLCSLMALAEASGVPRGDMAIYAKYRTVWQYEKDPRPPRKPDHHEKGTEYSPIRLVLGKKAIRKKDRDAILQHTRILFATYGMMAKGADVPRLSAGVDVTPRSEATQVRGRILRPLPGKLRPIWVTVADVNSFRSLYQLSQRLPDYVRGNAEVYLWDFSLGRKLLDTGRYSLDLTDRVAELRRSQITMSLDGNYTLMTLATPSDNGNSVVRRTVRTNH
jgi:hypothetical protein